MLSLIQLNQECIVLMCLLEKYYHTSTCIYALWIFNVNSYSDGYLPKCLSSMFFEKYFLFITEQSPDYPVTFSVYYVVLDLTEIFQSFLKSTGIKSCSTTFGSNNFFLVLHFWQGYAEHLSHGFIYTKQIMIKISIQQRKGSMP